MKKILTLVLFALISATSFAQSEYHIILKGGMGIGTWYGSGSAGCSARLAWKFGVGTSFDLGSNFAIQPYLYMGEKGAKFDGQYYVPGFNYTGPLSVRQDYIQVPILAAYTIPLSDEANITINLGPYIAYGFSGKTKLTKTAGELSAKTFKKEDDGGMGFKKFDAGLQFGVSGDYDNFILGVDGELGFIKLTDHENAKWKNFAVYVNIGYKF